jgi:hypothetical protein
VIVDPLLLAVFGIVAVFGGLAWLIATVDGLAFLAPASTGRIRGSADSFCSESCRAEGNCPLTGSLERARDCPLWRFVEADVPTALRGSPFRPAKL